MSSCAVVPWVPLTFISSKQTARGERCGAACRYQWQAFRANGKPYSLWAKTDKLDKGLLPILGVEGADKETRMIR